MISTRTNALLLALLTVWALLLGPSNATAVNGGNGSSNGNGSGNGGSVTTALRRAEMVATTLEQHDLGTESDKESIRQRNAAARSRQRRLEKQRRRQQHEEQRARNHQTQSRVQPSSRRNSLRASSSSSSSSSLPGPKQTTTPGSTTDHTRRDHQHEGQAHNEHHHNYHHHNYHHHNDRTTIGQKSRHPKNRDAGEPVVFPDQSPSGREYGDDIDSRELQVSLRPIDAHKKGITITGLDELVTYEEARRNYDQRPDRMEDTWHKTSPHTDGTLKRMEIGGKDAESIDRANLFVGGVEGTCYTKRPGFPCQSRPPNAFSFVFNPGKPNE